MEVSADITGVKAFSVGKQPLHQRGRPPPMSTAPLHIGFFFPKHYILTPLQHVCTREPSLA